MWSFSSIDDDRISFVKTALSVDLLDRPSMGYARTTLPRPGWPRFNT
jgi:hypothetical protein